MATLTVEVLAPEEVLWRGAAEALVARSSEGDFTVLALHTDTVGDVVSTVVRVQTGEGEIGFAVHHGFFQVSTRLEQGETVATVLASVAERIEEIDVARAQAALERAQAILAASSAEQAADEEYVLALAAKERAELRLRAAGR